MEPYCRMKFKVKEKADHRPRINGNGEQEDNVAAAPFVQMIKLETSDGVVISVPRDVASKSVLIKNMLTDLGIPEDGPDARLEEALPISSCDGKTLRKLMDYCVLKRDVVYRPKAEHEDPRIELTAEDNKYMDIPNDELVNLVLGANFLDIPEIIDITTQKIANYALGKNVEELREVYGLENDYTAQEEKEILDRFAWVDQ